jgi:hypothetical protein
MQKLLFDKLNAAIHSVIITSEYSYKFEDRLYVERVDVVKKEHSQSYDSLAENVRILPLATLLYRIYHCHIPSISDDYFSKAYRDNRAFVERLSQNNFGTGFWEEGWKIVKIENNHHVAAFKNGLTVWLDSRHFKPQRGGKGGLIKGIYGYVFMPKEFQNLLPSFYMVNGNEVGEERRDKTLVRMYWNIQSSHSWLLVRLISTRLNNIKVPFRFKIVNDPIGYPRADAAVLYIDKEFYTKAKNTIRNIYADIREFLNSNTPLFAKRMAMGLSLAEDPNNSESFGMHRSRLLAESLYTIKRKNITSLDKIMEELDLCFKKSNIDLHYPFLNSGSTDDYRIFESDGIA